MSDTDTHVTESVDALVDQVVVELLHVVEGVARGSGKTVGHERADVFGSGFYCEQSETSDALRLVPDPLHDDLYDVVRDISPDAVVAKTLVGGHAGDGVA